MAEAKKAAASKQQNDKQKGKREGKKAEPKPRQEWTDELQKDYDRIFSVGEKCSSSPGLRNMLIAKGRGSGSPGFILYDGFEPSGRMHIGQGVFKAMNVNKCTAEGTNATFVFWVADWFALMNDKMGGDLEKIKTVGHYLIEVWKAAGMDLSHVVFKWASEEITNNADKYWPTMLGVARHFNVTRLKRCCQIMGRQEGTLTAAQILYPLMQCTDIFFLNADVCQLGVDQLKVNMLALEYCDAVGITNKPIILSHHMLYGLKAGQEKMSKSDPDSAVFMEDAAEDVERKIMNAYCPSVEDNASITGSDEKDAGKDKLKNPCLDYIKHIIFTSSDATFTAGSTEFTDFDSVRASFVGGEISEEELKRGLIRELNRLLEPVRSHFANDENAKLLLETVHKYKKESLGPTKARAIRRLNLIELNKVRAGSHLVFAPLPNANPPLQEAVDTLAQLRQSNGRPKVLFLSDWSARVRNACGADVKAIAAYYSILVTSLKVLEPKLMDSVQILLQSDAILADPSNYWISVMNVGRHFMLQEVMGPTMKDSAGVGTVIGRLMRIADVVGVEPASLSLADTADSMIERALISEFYEAKLPGMTVPNLTLTSGPVIRLKEAPKTENDEYFLLDDPEVHGMSKMKKAFCQPGNISFCPPIAIVSVFAFDSDNSGPLVVKRSDGNGGDLVYQSVSELENDFVSGSLHYGDLKAAAALVMVSILEKLSVAIKADAQATVTKYHRT